MDAPVQPGAAGSVELLREFERTGRSEPFEELVRRHAGMVFATCLKVTRDPHDAEDATQATFLTLAAKGRINGEIHTPEAWLRKVAHRLSLDLIRSKKRRNNREAARGEMVSEVQPLDSHDRADQAEATRILNEELAKLPSGYRMPLILHYFGGLSREEMAAQLKVKPSTLGVRLHRAREQLRRRMTARGLALPTAAVALLLTEVIRGKIAGSILANAGALHATASAGGYAAAAFGASASGGAMYAGSGVGLPTVASIVAGVRSALNAVAISKLKLAGIVLALGCAISVSAAKVVEALPAAIRQYLPSLGWPELLKPKFQSPSLPRLSANNPTKPSTEDSGPPASVVARSMPAFAIPAVPAQAGSDTFASMALPRSDAPLRLSSASRISSSQLPPPVVLTPSTIGLMAAPARAIIATPSPYAGSASFPGVAGVAVPAYVPPAPVDRPSVPSVSASIAGGGSRGASRGTRSDAWNSVIPDPFSRDSSGAGPSSDLGPAPVGSASATAGGSAIDATRSGRSVGSLASAALPSALADPSSPVSDGSAFNGSWSYAHATNSSTTLLATTSTHATTLPLGDSTSGRPVKIGATDSTSIGKASGSVEVASAEAVSRDGTVQVIRYVDTSPIVGGYDLQATVPTKLVDSSRSLENVGWARADAAFYSIRREAGALDGLTASQQLPPNPLLAPDGPNSARVVVHGGTGVAVVDYLDTSFASLPALPAEHTFFGFWAIDGAGTIDGVDLLVRYDDLRMARLGLHEWAVKLWVSDGVEWTNLLRDPSFGRDTAANLVWADYTGGDVKYFAVSTPEPATLVGALGAASLLLTRRRAGA